MDEGAVRMLPRVEDGGELASPHAVHLQYPDDERVAAEERAAPRFPVAVPEFFVPDNSPQRAWEDAPERNNERVIEPDDRLCLPDGQVAHGGVIPVHNPAVATERFRRPRMERRVGQIYPVRPMHNAVEFDMRHVEQSRKMLRKGGFTGRRHADHRDTATERSKKWWSRLQPAVGIAG